MLAGPPQLLQYGQTQDASHGVSQHASFDEGNTGLYPFQLFSGGNYLGDTEVHFGRSRFCAARCEHEGTVLMLHQDDLQEIQIMFPQFHHASNAASMRRDAWRGRRLRALRIGRTYRHLAASDIQAFWRRYRHPNGKVKQVQGAPEEKEDTDTIFASAIQKKIFSANINRGLAKGGIVASHDSGTVVAEEVRALRADFEAFAHEVRVALAIGSQSRPSKPESL